jgi:hypothetical protein
MAKIPQNELTFFFERTQCSCCTLMSERNDCFCFGHFFYPHIDRYLGRVSLGERTHGVQFGVARVNLGTMSGKLNFGHRSKP